MKVCIPLIDPALTGESGWIAGLYYVKNILNALAVSGKETPEHTIIVKESFPDSLLLPELTANSEWLKIQRVSENDSSIVRRKIEELSPDVLLTLNVVPEIFSKITNIGWIPDFQHLKLPELFSEKDILSRNALFQFHAGFDSAIFLSSADSYNDFTSFFPDVSEKAHIYRFAAVLSETMLKENVEICRSKYQLPDHFIYLPNQFWKHKNHELAFKAWKILTDRGFRIPLVLTGNPKDYRFPELYNNLMKFASDNNLMNYIISLGFINRNDQLNICRMADLILQPSLFEGWSTSVEEAKVFGKRFIASDIPVHLEQISNGIFFRKDDPEDLAEKVKLAWSEIKPYSKEDEKNYFAAYQNTVQNAAIAYKDGLTKAIRKKGDLAGESKYLKTFLAFSSADELNAKLMTRCFNVLKDKEDKIQELHRIMLDMNGQMKEKDVMINRHHHFAQELMAELAKRKIKFSTKWPE